MGKHSTKKSGFPSFGRRGPGGAKKKPFETSGAPLHPAAGASARPATRKNPVRTAGASPGGPAKGGQSLQDPSKRKRGALEVAPAKLRIERERRKRRMKRLAVTISVGVLLLVLIAAGGVYAYAKYIERTMQRTVVKQEKLIAALERSKPDEPFTILLLGGDHRPNETRYRTDTMILARIDAKTKEVWMMSIPRDTKVHLDGHGSNKINQAYYFGGPELAIDTVTELTGVPINHYMEINFRGFEKAVNALGGVWVDVPTEIDDEKAAGHSPGYRAKHIDAGYQLLDGEHALTFVRSRDYPDADFSRMKSQQIFFKAVADQVAKKEYVVKLPKVVSSIAPYIATDMSLMEMLKTAQALRSAGSGKMYTTSLRGEWKSPYVYIDEDEVSRLVELMQGGRSFDPTKSVEPSGTTSATSTTSADEPATQPEMQPEDIDVTIRNGAGIAGCAKQASSILKARGFEVGDVGNANQFVYETTLVVYRGDRKQAELVAAGLHPGVKVVESRGMYSFKTDVLVVIGKDWDVSKIPVTPVNVDG